MNFQNNTFVVTRAEKKDTEDIRNILESARFKGAIEVQNLRGDDPLSSFEKEGTEAFISLLRENSTGKAVGMGGCILRPAFVNGEIKTAAYLLGLYIIPEYQKKVRCLAELYRYLYDATKDRVDFYYSSILEDNAPMLKLVQKRRKNMPAYTLLDTYTTYFCKTGTRATTDCTVKPCALTEIQDFYTQEAAKYNLSYPSYMDNDGKNADFYAMYQDDILVGMGYLLNQQAYKQYIIRNYSGMYKYVSKLPTSLLQYPTFPKKNQPANYASMGVMVKDNNNELGHALIQQILQHSPKRDFILMGLFASDPLSKIFSKIRHIHYKSRIYHVSWDNEKTTTEELQKSCMKLDGAFL